MWRNPSGPGSLNAPNRRPDRREQLSLLSSLPSLGNAGRTIYAYWSPLPDPEPKSEQLWRHSLDDTGWRLSRH